MKRAARERCLGRSSAPARFRSVLSAVDVLTFGADVSPAGERLGGVNVALVVQQELRREIPGEVQAVVGVLVEHRVEEGDRELGSQTHHLGRLQRGRYGSRRYWL